MLCAPGGQCAMTFFIFNGWVNAATIDALS